ncbi:hypothetical protein M427DRAFT_383101 [Gonapodya prolifera JEL478]|uniref:O-acyltransferase WSD1 C-terminal domain-containing protein n=1 Tax=Gonapodya prolifera (strain JEL478) TaxID=1344416 RepID=A0A139A8L1_GONPJ|nr:hypothetical protein M427DRAFT_383101 [Gonapodya prolifera JEL478]|eukprot:KXS13136.1 hypothetical protein M427DRAFT_383101 [Gonapodya prolifera JEL478]
MTATLATGAFPKDSGIPMPTTQHILWFEVLPPLPAVRQVLVDHFAPHRRFHSVPYVSKEGEVEWESEGGFSLDYHIHTLTLPSESAILSYVSSLFPASSFGRGKPLWNVSLLRNEGEGKSAIVVNVALVVGDVSSFLEVLVGGLTDAHGSPLSPSHLRTVLRPSLPPTSLSALSHLPAYTSAHLRVLRKQLSPPDHATSIKPAHDPYIYTAQREIVLCPAVEFDTVKEIQKGLEAKLGVKVTVSEVLTAAVSGAVRRYLVARGDEVLKREGKNVRTRALLPFAYREARPAPPTTPGAPAPTDLDGYSNRWSFLSINLPVGEPDPLERVRKCKTELDLKRVLPEAAAQANVQRWTMGVVPEEIAGKTNLEGFTRHTLVLANVPFHHPSFPPGPLFFAGEPVISMHPVISSALPTATLFTYAGMLSANFVVDPEEWKDHESVGGFWVEELGELASVVGVSVGEDA